MKQGGMHTGIASQKPSSDLKLKNLWDVSKKEHRENIHMDNSDFVQDSPMCCDDIPRAFRLRLESKGRTPWNTKFIQKPQNLYSPYKVK